MATMLLIAWWVSGVASFVYWWTADCDFEMNLIPLAALLGCAGPLTFVVGWGIHGKHTSGWSRVLVRRRKQPE